MKKYLLHSNTNKSRSNENIASIYPQRNLTIQVPTQINARQRIHSNFTELSPLLLSPHFHTLVQLSSNPLFGKYLLDIPVYFHLLHSIASQEFQIIVHNYEHQSDFHYPPVSLIDLLRQTIVDYSKNLHGSYKRHHFHLEHTQTDEEEMDGDEAESHNELSIPPLKIRRYDDSSYEIDKRSTSSSSSGMSITQVNNGHTHEDRRRLDTRPKQFSSRFSDIQLNSNSYDSDRKDIPDSIIGSPLPSDLSLIDQQQSKE